MRSRWALPALQSLQPRRVSLKGEASAGVPATQSRETGRFPLIKADAAPGVVRAAPFASRNRIRPACSSTTSNVQPCKRLRVHL